MSERVFERAERPVRVVVVDDQAPFREAAHAVVDRLAGFDIVAEAASGEEAIDAVDELAPDLVLMDINMGGIDGIEATSQITSRHPTTMVVLLSTYTLADLPPAARNSGAAAYVNKDEFGGRILRRLWAERGDPSFRPVPDGAGPRADGSG
jgi:two-component system, NarL family, invasion response regulator UvrY